MPLIRGANVTFTSGNDNCLDFVTDGTYIYNTSAPAAAAGRVVKTTISPFAQTAVATLSKENTLACTVLGGYVFTTHSDLPITDANAGLVLKTDTSTMLEVSSTNLWSPGPGSRRQSGAIYNDGTFLYVGSSAYSPTVGVWVNTKTTQMDTSFGSQTEVTLPTKGTTYSPHVVDGD
ncbi:hypothetical protein, partial [Nitrospira sp. BLG_2]|uniref:hypothetical protein n=1 Tax=Nitrospira sp. BLG_2 TaxID=3397507 RepID=UPI003B9B7590